jgi:DNA end-binding protein Ku
MARTLVEQLADKWDPSQYKDEYRENLMKIIKAKLKGKQPKLSEPIEPQNAEVIDLMERLRQSLQGAQKSKKKAVRASRATTRAKSKRTRAA